MFSFCRRIVVAVALFVLCGLVTTCNAQDADGRPVHVALVSSVKEKFDDLGPRSKFAVGAAGGFVATRIALGSAMTALKVGALAFITSEVLHQAGLLDEVEDVVSDVTNSNTFKQVKNTVTNCASNFRVNVRKTLRPVTVQEFLEKERMVTLGGASGVIVGLLL